MTFKKFVLVFLCSLTLTVASSSAMAVVSTPPTAILRDLNELLLKNDDRPTELECIAVDLLNLIVTPLPISDPPTDKGAGTTTLQQALQVVSAGLEMVEYFEKLQKLSASMAVSLKQKIPAVEVTEIESSTKGSETHVKAFQSVNFENADSTERAVSDVAIVADPVGAVEELALKEKRDAFIQQAFIDLHADVLVAKRKLADLKKSDSDAQSSSSTKDTNGNDSLVIRMKNFENQVQVLEQKILAMRVTFEGLRDLKSAKTSQTEIRVEGKLNE